MDGADDDDEREVDDGVCSEESELSDDDDERVVGVTADGVEGGEIIVTGSGCEGEGVDDDENGS